MQVSTCMVGVVIALKLGASLSSVYDGNSGGAGSVLICEGQHVLRGVRGAMLALVVRQ